MDEHPLGFCINTIYSSDVLSKNIWNQASVAQLIERHPMHKVISLIPSLGTCRGCRLNLQ